MPREDWILFSIPVLLVVVLFVVSPITGLIAGGCLVAVVAIFLFVGFLLGRARDMCPSCAQRQLKQVNRFRANPGPNYSFHRCERCDAEFVQRHVGQKEFVARKDSGMSQHFGWDEE